MDKILDEGMMEIVHRLADAIARDTARALQDANLEAQVVLQQADTGFQLMIRSRLEPAKHREAEDIAEAVLEGALARSTGRCH